MPMLGRDPWTADGKTYIRWSLAVKQGHQAFWTTRDGGQGLGYDHISNIHPEYIALGCDTIVLNPIDYEIAKKSMMESRQREAAREAKKDRGRGDLRGFDAQKHFREQMARELERKKG